MSQAEFEYDPDEALKLSNQLCFPLYVVSKEVVKRYTPYLNEVDLTYTQYIAMMVLWEKRSVTVSELGDRLYLDSGTLTPLLKKLEAKGLVTRTRSKEDERKVVVELTEQGLELKQKAGTIPLAMAGCVNLTLDEIGELQVLLRKIMVNVKESEE